MAAKIPQLVILIFSIVFHEVAHGRIALWRGDTTARDLGRLTMNPIPHIDPIGSILVPLFLFFTGSPFLFGWAKPVPVNPWRFRDTKKDMAIVSFSGPASNLLLAILASVLFRILLNSTGESGHLLVQLLFFTVYINLVLAFFNLIPIPPLDGSKILMAVLPDQMLESYLKIERFGFIILMLLIAMGFFRMIIFPIVQFFIFILTGISL